jgi:hypothetical protein
MEELEDVGVSGKTFRPWCMHENVFRALENANEAAILGVKDNSEIEPLHDEWVIKRNGDVIHAASMKWF